MSQLPKNWESAVQYVARMCEEAKALPNNTGLFYCMSCNDMLGRYEQGERSDDLYMEMISLS